MPAPEHTASAIPIAGSVRFSITETTVAAISGFIDPEHHIRGLYLAVDDPIDSRHDWDPITFQTPIAAEYMDSEGHTGTSLVRLALTDDDLCVPAAEEIIKAARLENAQHLVHQAADQLGKLDEPLQGYEVFVNPAAELQCIWARHAVPGADQQQQQRQYMEARVTLLIRCEAV